MVANRRKRVLQTQLVWMVAALLVLTALGMLTPEFYFTISLIGFIAVLLLFAPVDTEPSWWFKARLVKVAGLLVFGYFVYQRILTVLS